MKGSVILIGVLVLSLLSFADAVTTGNMLGSSWNNPSAPSGDNRFSYFGVPANKFGDTRFCSDINPWNTVFQHCESTISIGQDFRNITVFNYSRLNITSYTFGCNVNACTNNDAYSISVYFEDVSHNILKSDGWTAYTKCSSSSDGFCVPRCVGEGSGSRYESVLTSTATRKLPEGIDHVRFVLSAYNSPFKATDSLNNDNTDTAIIIGGCSFTVTLDEIISAPRVAPVGVYTTYWANPESNDTLTSYTPVSSAETGDTVFAVVFGTNSTTTLNYSLYSFNNFNGSQLVSPKFATGPWVNISYLSYVLTPSVLTNYSFNASFGLKNNRSSNLTVNSSANNFLPVSIINAPINVGNYSTNVPIWFNQSSSDRDDLLNLVWDFGDGDVAFIENYSAFEKNFNSSLGNVRHSYSSPGTYNVVLSAIEKTRGQVSNSTVRIFVVKEGVNVFPVINSPRDGRSAGSRLVFFNASQTYVVNCSVASAPSGVSMFINQAGLYCWYLHYPGNRTHSDLGGTYKLFFNWSLGDGNYRTGYWNSANYSGTNGVVEFLHSYGNSGVHNAKLKVSYEL